MATPASNQPEFSPDSLTGVLFQNPDDKVYAVLDAASIPDLLDHLYAKDGPEFCCLYRGELPPDMAHCAPYLVRLQPHAPFTQWVIAEGWGNHWGIFAVSRAELKALTKHFRSLLTVQLPDGQQRKFRYYDPRIWRVYLPTCNPAETAAVGGPVKHYILENERPDQLLRFWPDQAPPRKEVIPLPPGQP